MSLKNPFKPLTPEEKAESLRKIEANLDKKFVEEYNKLVRKYKRTLIAQLQVAKVKEE